MITEFQKKKKPKTGNDSWKPYHRVFEKSFKRKLTAKLDRVFSKYIRLRDTDENGYFTCPTCGKVKPFEKADCSHYWSRSHMSTRWDEENTLVECSFCNRFDSSHLDGLGKYLKKKLGEQKFELLNWRHNQPAKFSEFELGQMIIEYEKKVAQLKRTKNFNVK